LQLEKRLSQAKRAGRIFKTKLQFNIIKTYLLINVSAIVAESFGIYCYFTLFFKNNIVICRHKAEGARDLVLPSFFTRGKCGGKT